MYTIKDSERKNTIEAYDEEGNLVGEAIFSPFKASDIHEKPRINIYFDINVNNIEGRNELKDKMFDEIIKCSRTIKENYKDFLVRVYHCCFSDNKEGIEYYSSKVGFKNDEGMYIIKKELTNKELEIKEIKGIDFCKLQFENEHEMMELVEKQNKVFVNGYSMEDLKELKNKNQWFSIAAKHKGEIIGNIVIVIKEDEANVKYGWVDDLFVSKEWRKFGISKNLILKAFEELIALDVKESRLEVWSDNKRALSVYESVGYKFYQQIECSIGMFL
ncbi:GNAT family N-acetyltransferase [Clostridium algidicarnis]|uniref:GNAT family N-acetyltransferase n=1 Tax=Clostridium algidicarnis TaxID=37659 RepID=UPI001C0E0E74|nr:GNAT family N-acetyltransferase [Clostridium algidicarnis]MBU3203592.1 GNAT family N-acetyltransferase [Clostridium algidicarnis]MBU3211746.1 GNAT family N-acetyltransferase [Clostridium algidicarnis]MBU3221747.1 GNAT family N-acetyltransferase [Clostridium algidicarnis]